MTRPRTTRTKVDPVEEVDAPPRQLAQKIAVMVPATVAGLAVWMRAAEFPCVDRTDREPGFDPDSGHDPEVYLWAAIKYVRRLAGVPDPRHHREA